LVAESECQKLNVITTARLTIRRIYVSDHHEHTTDNSMSNIVGSVNVLIHTT